MAVFRKNDAWWVDIYLEGRRVRRKIGPDKRTAELAAKNMQVEAAKGKWLGITKDEKVRFSDFFEQRFFPRLRRAKATIRNYDISYHKHFKPFFGSIQLRQIRREQIDGYVAARAKDAKASTVNMELSQIHAILNTAVRWGYLAESPAKGATRLRVPESEVQAMTADQVQALYAVVDPGDWLYTFLALALNTGMRKSEILNLTWDNVDPVRRRIAVVNDEAAGRETKTKRVRYLPINDFLDGVLSEHKRTDSPYVFPGAYQSRAGQPLHPEAVRKKYKAALLDAGLPYSFRIHDLRHTFGTTLAENREDPRTIMELMGHTTIEMTMRYIHTTEDRKAAAIANLGLDDRALRVYGH